MGTHSAPAWKACRWNHSEHPRRRQRCGRALCSRDVFAVKPSSSGAGCRWLFLRWRGAGGDYSAQRSAAPRERRGSARGNAEARPAVQGDQDEVGPPRPQSARRRRGGPQGAPPGPAGATLSLGPGKLPDDALLFPAPLSEAPLSPRNFSKRWEDAAAAIGVAGVTFHALRHTHASQLIDAGIDVVKISKRLGHASPNITAAGLCAPIPAAGGQGRRRHQRRHQCGAGGWQCLVITVRVAVGWQCLRSFRRGHCPST